MKKLIIIFLLLVSYQAHANFIKINTQIEKLQEIIVQSEAPFSKLKLDVIQAKTILQDYNLAQTNTEKIIILKNVASLLQPIGRSFLLNPLTSASGRIQQCYMHTIEIISKNQEKLSMLNVQSQKFNTTLLDSASADETDSYSLSENETDIFNSIDDLADSWD